MFVNTLEYTRWISGPWGAAAFIDVGDVANTWNALHPRVAIGFGPRYQTPAGPVAVDLAKARGERGPRLHFSLGVAF